MKQLDRRLPSFSCAAALILAAGSLALAVSVPAHADLKLVERTTFDFSNMTVMGNPITPDELDMIKKSPLVGNLSGVDITMYDAGSRLHAIRLSQIR